MVCCDLNENTWSPVRGTVWVGLEGVAFGEICHRDSIYFCHSQSVCFLLLFCGLDVSSQQLL